MDLDCCLLVILIVGSIFAHQAFNIFFLHKLEDWEIVEAVGYHWKDVGQIQKEILELYRNQWGGPRPFPTEEFLRDTLPKYVRSGWLESRETFAQNGDKKFWYHEYRRTSKRPTGGLKRRFVLNPEFCYEGV